MKRLFTFIMLLAFGSASFVSCSSGKKSTKGILGGAAVGGTVVKTVATVVGLILLSKLIKSVLNKIGGNTAFSSFSHDQNFMSNFNEATKLNSFAQSDMMKTALQLLVAEQYQIPFSKVAGTYSSLQTVGDLATFIGQNGSAQALNQIK